MQMGRSQHGLSALQRLKGLIINTIETKSHKEINGKETKVKKGDESSCGDIFPCEAHTFIIYGSF